MRNQKQLKKKVDKALSSHNRMYMGKVEKLAPLRTKDNKIRKGSTVITPRGLGVIHQQWPNTWTEKPGAHIEVYLNRKYIKSFYINECYQYAIFHEPTQQYVLLSPQCYGYIFENNQPVAYRITKRNYAMIDENYRKEIEIINRISKKRGGTQILKDITNSGYILVKEGEEIHYDPAKVLNDIISLKVSLLKGKVYSIIYRVQKPLKDRQHRLRRKR